MRPSSSLREPLSGARAALLALALWGSAASAQDPAASSAPEPLPRVPAVAPGESGPARFVSALYDSFGVERALACAAFVDQWYRAPANEGYEASLEHLRELLSAAGFGAREGFELEVLESPMRQPAWTPRSASLELLHEGAEPERLLGFDAPGDRDRTMLPVHAPSAQVEGPLSRELEGAPEGSILLTREMLDARVLRRAQERGLAGVLSSALRPLNVDPSGRERHLDAILFHQVPAGTRIAVAQISPRVHARLEELLARGAAPRVALRASVESVERPLRTLVATLVGDSRPQEAIAIASHVQEPGAGDNASGVAGIAEGARALAQLVAAGAVARPARSIVFLWGDEFRQSQVWLEKGARRPIAAISADMLGQSPERTGAIALLERAPDPGALVILPPEEHTPWGAGRVEESELAPNGLALVARTALRDVAAKVGGWTSSEHPWEGGSDHDVFLRHEVPAILLWHFTDFSYHTGLDRMEMLDGEELRRTAVALLATALAVADARPADLERYLSSLALERELRLEAARRAGRADVAAQWERWCEGAADWLRALCEARTGQHGSEQR